ncbi:hypothetical protein JR316_0003773 [Psilocybe cubensis]|uniref:Uncharacterized protein n=1 Tax=Psilocybe cubensis TaxID=181762 RepID=A0ACB8H9F9_PSICU|nr:hypothetical protein JR316_0003773 [Psilocybe cubensis]KAH9484292.1 hypothetical protein JR316_0003773 [Psilocybe cubensis]
MTSEGLIDLIPLERQLHQLTASIRIKDEDESWNKVASISQELANNLRSRDPLVDKHTILGKTELPQTLTSLLSLGLRDSHLPGDSRTAPILELLRVGANLCMDHDENRAALLEVGFPQSVMSLLEGYAETIPTPPYSTPLPLSIPHLKIVRTSIGVLLNASIGYDAVKFRLISLEAAMTIIKLSSTIYPPTSWTLPHKDPINEEYLEEWTLRSGISNWAWRTVSALKDVQDEKPSLLNDPTEENQNLFDSLVQTDFDFMEESCTIIESLSLDVEDFRLELARAMCYPTSSKAIPCLTVILDFIEYGTYSPLWANPMFEDVERKNKEKAFDICKAALIKAIVEVFAEEKNEEILWTNDTIEQSGGPFVARLVQWIKRYVEAQEIKDTSSIAGSGRDDMAICASLSLGNLIRKAPYATALLSKPYSLAPVLASSHFFSTSTDIKLKHGILGLLKHLSQFSKLSSVIPISLAEVGIIDRISASGIWDEKSDAMADVIQLNAIGVAKHMCNASIEHTIALVLPSDPTRPSGLSQILALIKRSDSVSIRSEGSRVLVNVVKSLWFAERSSDPADEKQKKREQCVANVLTQECANTLTALIGRSNKYPILVNEGIVAVSLLCTHRLGGPLVLNALTVPVKNTLPAPPSISVEDTLSPINGAVPSPEGSSRDGGLPVPRHALDMLVYVLRNIENPVNFPYEVRVNTCTFFLQLQRHTAGPSLDHVRDTVLPVIQDIKQEISDYPEGVDGEEKLLKAVNLLIDSWTRKQPSV